jgi:hypothetical protein
VLNVLAIGSVKTDLDASLVQLAELGVPAVPSELGAASATARAV